MISRIKWKLGNPILFSPTARVYESWAMVKTHWRRLPKSKKRRVRKKWEQRQAGRYRVTVPSNEIFYVDGGIVCHPIMAAHLRAMRTREHEILSDVVQGAFGVIRQGGS